MKILGIIIVVLVVASCGGESTQEVTGIENEIVESTDDLITEEVIATEPEAEVDSVDQISAPISCETSFSVYISDPGEAYTNVRNSPSGEVIMELAHDEVMQDYMLHIITVEEGWYKFEGPILGSEEDLDVPGGFGWVHHSVVATDTRNYGGQTIKLYESANETSSVVGTIEIEAGGLRILDACEDWVLIELKFDDYYRKGWMKTEWCCGNPFTNCS